MQAAAVLNQPGMLHQHKVDCILFGNSQKDVTNGDVILLVLKVIKRCLKDCFCPLVSVGRPLSSLFREIFVKKERSSFHRSILCLLFIPLALSLEPVNSLANDATVTLSWDSNSEPDLEGYVVYRNSGSPGPPFDYATTLPEDDFADPLHPRVTLTGLNDGQEYYIALTAYNTDGVESNFSNDVCVRVVNDIIEPCVSSNNISASTDSSGGGGGGGGSGGGGHSSSGCFISTASPESSIFSKFIVKPVIRSKGLAAAFLLLLLLAVAKFAIRRTKRN